MWRVRGGATVLASLKPRTSTGSAIAARFPRVGSQHRQWRTSQQQQNAGVWQQLANFSSEPSGRSQCQEETPALRSSQGDEAMKITRVGMYVNVAMAATKGAVGVAIHSSALVADAAHSLSDLLSDVVTLWSVKVARLPPDPKHPYGYGKYEAVGSLSVGAILVLCGIGIGADGLQVMQDIWNGAAATQLPEFDLPLLSELDRGTQWALAAGAAGVSIAAKEALYHATVKIGKQANSKVLIANAWHHRTDAISSVVALGGIVGSMFGVPLLDPVAGMTVAAMIVKTGGEICLDSVQELTDNTVEAEVLETLKEVSGSVDDVLNVSQVRARRMGPYTLVDLRVHLDARTSISMAQQIAERVRSHILQEVPDVSEVLVHIDVQFEQFGFSAPAATEACKKDFRPYREIKNDISYALATIPEITGTTHINTHWLPHLTGQGTAVDVTIVVQPDLKVGAAHAVAKKARKAIEAIPYIVEADIHLELQDDDSDQVHAAEYNGGPRHPHGLPAGQCGHQRRVCGVQPHGGHQDAHAAAGRAGAQRDARSGARGAVPQLRARLLHHRTHGGPARHPARTRPRYFLPDLHERTAAGAVRAAAEGFQRHGPHRLLVPAAQRLRRRHVRYDRRLHRQPLLPGQGAHPGRQLGGQDQCAVRVQRHDGRLPADYQGGRTGRTVPWSDGVDPPCCDWLGHAAGDVHTGQDAGDCRGLRRRRAGSLGLEYLDGSGGDDGDEPDGRGVDADLQPEGGERQGPAVLWCDGLHDEDHEERGPPRLLQGLGGALHAARPPHHLHLPLLGGGQEDRGRTRVLM